MVFLTSANKALVGVIGLGNMGAFMARNLAKGGHQLVVYDLNKKSVDELVSQSTKTSSITGASSPAELAGQVDNIITMLPSHPHVTDCFTKKGTGILAGVKPNTLCIDCSTIDIEASKHIRQLCESENKSIVFNDAPVSGGVTGAENGTLTFMCGANSKDEFERLKPLLECMGKNVVHCGEQSLGLAAKICNNMMLAISMIGTSETMNLAMRLGLDKHVMANVMNTSTGRSWSSEIYNPVPEICPDSPPSKNYAGGFANELMAKDLGLGQLAAVESGSSTPLGSASYNLYRQMSNSGFAKKDMGYAYQFLKSKEE